MPSEVQFVHFCKRIYIKSSVGSLTFLVEDSAGQVTLNSGVTSS